MAKMDAQKGHIKKLVADKGFGFIRGLDGTEFFFHRSDVDPASPFMGLRETQEVTFTPTDSPKGPRASGVRVA